MLGDQDNLEDKAYMKMVNMEPGLTWGYSEDPVMDAHAQFVSVELDPPLGDPHEDACTHSKHTEPEVLTNIKNDLLHEVKEVEEEKTGKETTDVDKGKDPRISLQELGVSQQDTMLEGTDTPTFPFTPLRTASPLRLPVIKTGTQATRELRPGVNTDPPPLNIPSPKWNAEPLNSSLPKQIQAPTQVERPLKLLWGKKLQRVMGQDSQVLAHILEGKTPLGIAHGCLFNPANLYM